VRVWTTHGEYLAVFYTVQNLVGIDAVFVFRYMQVWTFNEFGLTMPVQSCTTMQILGKFDPVVGSSLIATPEGIFLHKTRHTTYRSLRSVNGPAYFWATVCETVCPMLSDRCLSCLSVTLVYCGQTVGWIKTTWYREVCLCQATLC